MSDPNDCKHSEPHLPLTPGGSDLCSSHHLEAVTCDTGVCPLSVGKIGFAELFLFEFSLLQ